MAKIIGVANSTPLIALSLIGRLDLLKELLGETLVPALVYHEVVPLGGTRPGVREVSQADWLIIKEPETVSPFPPSFWDWIKASLMLSCWPRRLRLTGH